MRSCTVIMALTLLTLAAACTSRPRAQLHPADAGPVPPLLASAAPPPPMALGSCEGITPRGDSPATLAVIPEPGRQLDAWLNGAELPGNPMAPRPAEDDALRAHGATLFAAHCTPCHGEKGDGHGPQAPRLAVAPRNFTAGVYALRTTESQSLPTDFDLFRTISRGIHGTAMIAWVSLPEADRWALVAHLKTLSKDFSEDEAPPPEVVPDPPPVTPELLVQGRAVYDKYSCKDCHGLTGHGDGVASATLYDATGRRLRPRDFTGARYWRSGDLKDLYLTLHTGLDGTPMASFARVATPADLWAVAAYVQSLAPRPLPGPGGILCPAVARTNSEELLGATIAGMLPAP